MLVYNTTLVWHITTCVTVRRHLQMTAYWLIWNSVVEIQYQLALWYVIVWRGLILAGAYFTILWSSVPIVSFIDATSFNRNMHVYELGLVDFVDSFKKIRLSYSPINYSYQKGKFHFSLICHEMIWIVFSIRDKRCVSHYQTKSCCTGNIFLFNWISRWSEHLIDSNFIWPLFTQSNSD
mgnify:CR=1 FL=1